MKTGLQVIGIGLILCVLGNLTGCGTQTEAETEKVELTLAVLENEDALQKSNLMRHVNRYNMEYDEIQIKVINYAGIYTDIEECLDRLKIEINAGKGPDMIDFGSYYSPIDAACGMMSDLYPFFESEKIFDHSEYYNNIIKSFRIGDSLYVLVPSISIGSFATENESLVNCQSVDVRQIEGAYKEMEEGAFLFPGETKTAVFGMWCYGILERFINWDTCECMFEGEDFKEILGFSNQFSKTVYIPEDFSAKKAFEEGKCLLYPVTISTVYQIAETRMLFGKTPKYIGYPMNKEYGNMALVQDVAVGITATCTKKEEAWDFIKSLLDREYQDAVEKGVPVRVKSLENKLEQALTPEYENGEKKAKSYLRFEGEEAVSIYQISGEDAETLKQIMSSIESNGTVDVNIYSIILDEVAYLFENQKDIDSVAKTIQNRVSIYAHEKR